MHYLISIGIAIVCLPFALLLFQVVRELLANLHGNQPFLNSPLAWVYNIYYRIFIKSQKTRGQSNEKYTERPKPPPRGRATAKFLNYWQEHFHPVNGKFSQINSGYTLPLAQFYDELYDEIYQLKAPNYKSIWREVFKLIHPDRSANSNYKRDDLEIIAQYYNDSFPKG